MLGVRRGGHLHWPRGRPFGPLPLVDKTILSRSCGEGPLVENHEGANEGSFPGSAVCPVGLCVWLVRGPQLFDDS